jgi:hypothetical protein
MNICCPSFVAFDLPFAHFLEDDMLTTPQLTVLYLPARRAGYVAGAVLSSLFRRYIPTFQGSQSAPQRRRSER